MELLYILLVVLAVTRLCGELAERLGQAALLGEIVGGIALGIVIHQTSARFTALGEATDSEAFTAITDLAIFFLMLLAGIELKPRQLAEASRKAVLIALGGFLVPLGAGFGLAWIFLPASELKTAQSLFVATALAITAIPVAVKILMDLGQLDSKVGNLIVSAALFDDVFSLILLAVLLGVVSTGTIPSAGQLLAILGNVAIFFAVTFAIGMFLIPRVAHLVMKTRSAEFEFSAILLYALAYSYFAEFMGLHFILGAFVAGMFFNRTTVDPKIFDGISSKLSGVTSGFLAPIFFASIGMHLQIVALAEIPLFVILLVIVAAAGKFVGAGLPAYWLGADRRDAAAIGVAMSARGAVELVIADIALRAGVFSQPDPPPPIVANLFSAVVIVAVATTLVAPLALRRLLPERSDGAEKTDAEQRN
ncbi:MAG: cation:proton antiporter [Novosphingobium sp.]|nr:cation:proton antiporter [Novosphingobium sp.]